MRIYLYRRCPEKIKLYMLCDKIGKFQAGRIKLRLNNFERFLGNIGNFTEVSESDRVSKVELLTAENHSFRCGVYLFIDIHIIATRPKNTTIDSTRKKCK